MIKNKAIQLRKEGNSYSEILREISVARSTLSLWLRSVNLSKRQKQNLTLKKLQACWRGGEVKKQNRIKKSKYQ
jgi:orotate phosphoribosyltransferase-like protein